MQDILKQATEDNLKSACELPYFEGDFWPNVLEESIKELDQEEEEKRKAAEALAASAAASEGSQDGEPEGAEVSTSLKMMPPLFFAFPIPYLAGNAMVSKEVVQS